MFNFKEGEMNEKDEDIIGRVLHYLESAEVNKNINTFVDWLALNSPPCRNA